MQQADLLERELGISGREPSVEEKFEKHRRFQERGEIQTSHRLICGDSRRMDHIEDESAHLVLTSPPYFDLVEYQECDSQLGHLDDYEDFLGELNQVWRECWRILIPGGRMCVVVGDVCRSRRKHGIHEVIPLHSDIAIQLRKLGFVSLATVFWLKIANASREIEGKGGFLGKPYEPNGVIKNDVEYVLRVKKPGPYRKPTPLQRTASLIEPEEYAASMRQVWTDIPGAPRRHGHPAPFPSALARRLIQTSSYVEDIVVDPFAGSGTTLEAASELSRNSIGYEIDPSYVKKAFNRVRKLTGVSKVTLD